VEAVGAPFQGDYVEQIVNDAVFFVGEVAVVLELVLKEQVSYLGGLANEALNHGMLSTDSEVFGDCDQFFVELDENGERWALQKLFQHFAHIFNKHLL